MQWKFNQKLIPAARDLRKNMTKEERHLWYDFLSNYPVPFKRQRIFGRFIADFYCAQAHLVIELDGSQHYDNQGLARDAERTAVLEAYGLTVIRIPNNEVNQNFEGVCRYIDDTVKKALHQV